MAQRIVRAKKTLADAEVPYEVPRGAQLEERLSSVLGVIYLIGRALYARAYINDPQTRSAGFLLSFGPSALMIVGSLVCVLLTVI